MSEENKAVDEVEVKYKANDVVDNAPKGDEFVNDFVMVESSTKAKVGTIIAIILSILCVICSIFFVIDIGIIEIGASDVDFLFGTRHMMNTLINFALISGGIALIIIAIVKIVKRFRYKNIKTLPRLVSIYLLIVFSFIAFNVGFYSLHDELLDGAQPIVKKPVIYAYGYDGDLDIEVNLNNAEFLCTYPDYADGWHVKASKDGKLTDGKNKYDYLYYEAIADKSFSMDEGFCVKKEDTVRFLEEKLTYFGLNDREKEDFITYWLPVLSKNNYNVISFKQDEYEDIAKLNVSPKADKIIRVYMVFKGSDDFIDISAQHFKEVKRNDGEKLIVEWGGSELD